MNSAASLLPPDAGPTIRPALIAKHLGITTDAVRKMIRRGDLPQPIRIGKRFAFRTEVVRAALAKLTAGAGEGEHAAAS